MATTTFEDFAGDYIFSLIADAVLEEGFHGACLKLFYGYKEPTVTDKTIAFLGDWVGGSRFVGFEKIEEEGLRFVFKFDGKEVWEYEFNDEDSMDKELKPMVLAYLE